MRLKFLLIHEKGTWGCIHIINLSDEIKPPSLSSKLDWTNLICMLLVKMFKQWESLNGRLINESGNYWSCK